MMNNLKKKLIKTAFNPLFRGISKSEIKKEFPLFIFLLVFSFISFSQGSYAPTVGEIGTTAIYKDSTAIERWADSCTVVRGWQDITDHSLGKASNGVPSAGVGNVDNATVSLGDSGVAILTFNTPIKNIDGYDFAVFENSFSDDFLELAFVEVSSDGIHYFRFDAYSETDTTVQIGTFGSTDATNIHHLAGKYRGQYGTPFDLEEFNGVLGLDLNAITHLKLIDVVGSINPQYASRDALGRIINDPFPTAFESSGFDLDGVAVLKIPPAVGINAFSVHQLKVYPNPATDFIQLTNTNLINLKIYNSLGILIDNTPLTKNEKYRTTELPKGVYTLVINSRELNETFTLLKL